MQKRFEHELEFRLDEIKDKGASTVTYQELYRWFDRERITRSVWEDIEARWEKRDEDAPLFVGNNDSSYTLIWGAGLSATEDAYFQPIAVLAGTA
jgi:hypothetical protein